MKGAALGPSKRNVWGADLIQYLKEIRSQGGVNVSFTGDAMSIHDNRVELDPVVKDPWGLPVAKTFYRHDTWDVEMSKYALNRVREAVENAGGDCGNLSRRTKQIRAMDTSTAHCGRAAIAGSRCSTKTASLMKSKVCMFWMPLGCQRRAHQIRRLPCSPTRIASAKRYRNHEADRFWLRDAATRRN